MEEQLSRSFAERGDLEVHAGLDELAHAAAALFVRTVAAATGPRSGGGRCRVALAGGNTPRSLYLLLSDPAAPYRSQVPWEDVELFWGDERHVPPDHPESNFRMVREALLDRVPVPPGNVHRIRGEEPEAARAAAEYEADLVTSFQLSPGGLPRFDLLLLGLGEEAHTASLFPGSPALAERARLVAAPWVAAHDTFRITLTPPVLSHAAQVAFLVSGASKAAALQAVLAGPVEPARYPAQIVRPRSGKLLWLIDRAAAGRLDLA